MWPTVNLLAVLVASVIYMAIGAFWYTPVVFGKLWLKLSGLKDMKTNMPMALSYILMFVGAFILNYFTAVFIVLAGTSSVLAGAMTGFFVWLGFVVTTSLSAYLFEKKPLAYHAINSGYYLVTLLISGAILGGWL